ncbi:MAG: galactose oxidase [Betaproteobacteria bacterium]|nr:galactose oxidase [Betaproteobacteria bacterium]
MNRRKFCGSLSAMLLAADVRSQDHSPGQPDLHDSLYSSLKDPLKREAPKLLMAQQHVFESPAPRAKSPGRWIVRTPLPVARSEMAWATVMNQQMHILGGYGEQRVDRAYHHVYDPKQNRWVDGPPLPRGANHVGVAVLDDRIYAVGGHLEQNRKPDSRCFVLKQGTWQEIAPFPQRCGAIALVALSGNIHAVGGAIGDTFADKKSVNWHYMYVPSKDQWTPLAPLPTGRDHTGTLVVDGLIHVLGGRVDSFHTNSNLHHSWDAKTDRWTMRNPLPTARSGHGAVLLRGKIFVMGGEGTNRVYGQNEAYDLQTDRWESYAPMLTPRHGMGAVVIGDTIYVAGGGPVMGGDIQSAIHEAFTLD